MIGSKKNEQNLYTAIPSFLISPSVAQATNELSATLDRTLTDLSAQYQVKFNDRTALNKEYKSVQSGSVTFAGRNYRSGETDVNGELDKAKAKKDDIAAKARKHNEEVKAKQAQLETEATAIAVKVLRIKTLLGVIRSSASMPLLFDAAAILVTRTPQEQILFLSLLTRGASFTFDNGAYTSSDVRLLDALLRANERVSLVGK